MRKLLVDITRKEYLLLYFVGLVFLLLGALLEPSEKYEATNFWIEKFSTLADAAGFSIIVTTLVASVLNFYFQSAISDRFSIIGGAEAAKIRRLFQNRKQALPQIKDESERVMESVDVLCISGTDLLQPRSDLLKQLDLRCRKDNNIHVRLLLLDPRSRYAVERSLREEDEKLTNSLDYKLFDYPNKKLCRDTILALQQLENLFQDVQEQNKTSFKMEVRLYNSAPLMHYVRIDNTVFEEQYHLGVSQSETKTAATKCLGKIVPTYEVAQSSEFGFVLSSHFDYLWEASETRTFDFGKLKILQNSLQECDWVQNFVALTTKENEEMTL